VAKTPMNPTEAIEVARFAFTRERAALETARCMVIGTARGAAAGVLKVLDNLQHEHERLVEAQRVLVDLAAAHTKARAEALPHATDPRFTLCVCPGCGWTGMRRPAEEDENSGAESFCTACGYEVCGAPYRLPSVDELVRGEALGQWSQVDLRVFVPALLRALGMFSTQVTALGSGVSPAPVA